MNYATIKYYDIANGPGVRTSVFVSGCRHRCPGCFNAVAWDFAYGQPFDKATRNQVFASCQPDYIAGLSLLGGEPFEPENQRELLPFVRNFKALYPNKTIWCYSGYTWEQLTGKEPCAARCEVTDELLQLLDVLVDGEFVQAKHDISLRFRGSSNQRLLDMPRTLAAGQPVWWEDEKVFATHTMEGKLIYNAKNAPFSTKPSQAMEKRGAFLFCYRFTLSSGRRAFRACSPHGRWCGPPGGSRRQPSEPSGSGWGLPAHTPAPRTAPRSGPCVRQKAGQPLRPCPGLRQPGAAG